MEHVFLEHSAGKTKKDMTGNVQLRLIKGRSHLTTRPAFWDKTTNLTHGTYKELTSCLSLIQQINLRKHF